MPFSIFSFGCFIWTFKIFLLTQLVGHMHLCQCNVINIQIWLFFGDTCLFIIFLRVLLWKSSAQMAVISITCRYKECSFTVICRYNILSLELFVKIFRVIHLFWSQSLFKFSPCNVTLLDTRYIFSCKRSKFYSLGQSPDTK